MTSQNHIKSLEKHLNIKFISHDIFWWFNDLETQPTLVVINLSDIEDKLIESRAKFKQEGI